MFDTVLKKSQVLQSLQNLPEEVNSEDLIEHIIFMAQLERSLHQIDEGKVIAHDQLMQQLTSLKAQKQADRKKHD